MKTPSPLVGAVLAASLLVLSACGTDEPDAEPTRTTSAPTPTASPTTSDAPSDLPTSSAGLELSPGAIGPVTVGMTKAEAEATGLFDVDVTDDGCGTTAPLTWKAAYQGVDVQTDPDGTVVSLGVRSADGPRTSQGFGVGSTFGELLEVYGGELSAPEEAGYGQVGVFVQDNDRWLGYLFGEAESIEALDNNMGLKVTFVEATQGEKPGLMRDGC